jgi:iron complex transport system permease protein
MPPLGARRLALSLGLLLLALAMALAVCASIGGSGHTLLDALRRPVAGGGLPGPPAGGAPADEADLAATLILRVRLPRLLLAALTGAALGAAGAVFQAVLRNPLADPYVLGISGGAALGFIVATALGLPALLPHLPARQAAAFLGAAGTVTLILALSSVGGRIASYPMLLTGVVLNTIFLAAILFVQSIVEMTRLHGVMLWMVGTIPTEGYRPIALLAALLICVVAALAVLGRDLNLMAAGEEIARSLGVRVERTRLAAILLASLATSAVVSAAGPVGFVGLIVPHAARLVFGPDHRLLVPASALAGALFLIVCDTAARTVMAPTELPVGVITALCGGPFFLWLFRARGRGYFE